MTIRKFGGTMSFKYIILNLLLLFVILMVAIENYETWNNPIDLTPEKGMAKKSEVKSENPSTIEVKQEPMSIQSYILISQKNIFSSGRKDFPIAPLEQSKTNVRPQVILYGVTLAEDYQSASVVNPGRPLRKGERETITLKMEEKIGDYKLAKVLPDRIALENNGDTFEVLLYDSTNPKKRIEVKTEVKSPTVTSPQPAPAPLSGEAPKPTPPQESAEKPKEPVRPQISPPPSSPRPTRPSFPPPESRRGRRILYPPSGPSAQEPAGN